MRDDLNARRGVALLPVLALAGALAICAMVVPGISGSFVLLLLGKYAYVLDAVGHFDFRVIAPFALGAAIGLFSFTRLLSWVLHHYERWSLVWESQARLRAEPATGDAALGARFVTLVDPLRYPRNGLARDDVREIRRLKSRVEAERLPRGADPATHTKLGRGGLSDVEWTVQLLQLQHAARVPGLRTTSTLAALESAADEQLIDAQDAETLAAAWRLATKVRNAIVLVRGRADDSLPKDQRDLAGVARLVAGGGATGGSGAASLVEEYRRATRRARGVVDRVFYG